MRYSPHEQIVLVGHSLFFRELFRELATPEAAAKQPQLEALRTKKVENCGVVCAELDLSLTAPIVAAHMLLGSKMESKAAKGADAAAAEGEEL